ncbi:MAG: TIGR00282 family metallophosphoesterase [Desulfarculaceae bacterium]|nr:TIGR00282 family metallophosphoesterase [Desulfarculaceae bacterium]
MLKLLMIGDVFGSPGRRCLKSVLPGLRQRLGVDLVIANGENASGGLGLSASVAAEIFTHGVGVITTGNHVWRYKDLRQVLDEEPRIIRPANYPGEAPGKGWTVATTKSGRRVGVMNLEGRVFMNPLEDPFRAADEILAGPLKALKVILVDMHGEATSEKQALGRYLDGRVSAVLGTHTHVPTADERILAGGTAYQSDVGLTGPYESVIGMDPATATFRLREFRPLPFKVAGGPAAMDATLVTIDETTGRATAIERVHEKLG